MSQCAAILDVLADRQWHTVADIHSRAGYSRLNSRVSELRDRGHEIECETVEGDRAVDRYRYRLVASPRALADPDGPGLRPDVVGIVERAHPARDAVSPPTGALEQLTLEEAAA